MKKIVALSLLALAGAGQAAELFDNGPVVNVFGRSVLRPPASTFGFGAQTVEGNSVADDFTVTGAGWKVTDIDFFGYQTFATGFTFESVSWSIVSGDVNTGTVVASGVTDVTNGGSVGYRVTTTTRTNKDRQIFDIKADISDVQLDAGSYWLTWNLLGSSDFSGPWQPPTSDRRLGNAQQALAGGEFAGLIDAGNGKTVELPFILNGVATTVPEPATALSLGAGLLALAWSRRRRA